MKCGLPGALALALTPSASYDGLAYETDGRVIDPDANYRRGRFKVGWSDAVDGAEMENDVLERLTWQNLGWRLGKLFGETSGERKEELYEWCEALQRDQHES